MLTLLQESQSRLQQLESLLEKSATYVKLLKAQMDQVRTVQRQSETKPKSKAKNSGKNTRKRARVVSDSEDERELKRTKAKSQEEEAVEEKPATAEKIAFKQPALLTGATLKDYQLEGVAWMAGLHQNGISGILGMSPRHS